MSQFSNPSGNASQSAAAYTKALLDILGDRDPLDVMSGTPMVLREIISPLADELVRRPERAGKWSVRQAMQHLADTELVYANRFRFPVAQDRPPIIGFDQEQWVARLWKGDEPLEVAVSQYDILRKMNLRFLRHLTEEEWERVGIHAERGEESVRHMVKLAAAHDLVHTAQIRRIAQAVSS